MHPVPPELRTWHCNYTLNEDDTDCRNSLGEMQSAGSLQSTGPGEALGTNFLQSEFVAESK